MSEELVYVYRGVHAKHPMLESARRGVVVPGKRDSGITPDVHNRGGWEAQSPYTSCTYDLPTARRYAMEEGRGYVVLRLSKYDSQPGEEWSWEDSPDLFEDYEVLLRGVRIDAEVVPDE